MKSEKLELECNYLLKYICKNNKSGRFDVHMKFALKSLLSILSYNNVNYILESDVENKNFDLCVVDDYVSNDKYDKCVKSINDLWRRAVSVIGGIN